MRALLLLPVALATGCATFVGIEDAEQHLPRLDGKYLISISRIRAGGGPPDIIRMQGDAFLDIETRTLDLSVNILDSNNALLTETSIENIEFPDDSDEVEYTINLNIPAAALPPTPVPTQGDLMINAPVRFIAEDDFSFCAKKIAADVTLGSRLVVDFSDLPAADADCDDPLRQ